MLNLVSAFLVPLALIAIPATQPRHTGAGYAQAPNHMNASTWMHMPYSGGYLFAEAVHHGWITPRAGRSFLVSHPELICRDPLPCVFPNVDASGGTMPVNETPIAVNPRNHRQLITGGNDFNCTTVEGYEVSSNGGKTWNHECGVVESGTGDGDPIVAFDLAGAAWRGGIDTFASNNDAVIVDKSTDGGTTWSAPVTAASNLYTPGFVDKPWLQIDTTPSSPRVGTMYISTTQFDSSQSTEITVSHSTDGGATWTMVPIGQRVNYPKDNMWSDVAIGPDGTVYVTWMRCTANSTTSDCGGTVATMLIASSSDGGNTWSAASKIERVHIAPSSSCGYFWGCLPNTHERLSNIPATAVDESSRSRKGTLYTIAYNYTGAFCQVLVTKSTNGGTTWSKPVAVAPGETHDQFMPWINVSSNGLVGATWLDRRNDPANHNYEEFAGLSADGGSTWSNLQVAASLSDPDNDGFQGKFMGDYTGNAWDGHKLYASWTDTTLDIAQDFVGGLRN